MSVIETIHEEVPKINDIISNNEYVEDNKNDEEDYESVDDETIKKNCENLEINTLEESDNKIENDIKEEDYDGIEDFIDDCKKLKEEEILLREDARGCERR